MTLNYQAVGNEIEVAVAAARAGLAILVIGPTGCGKTRFVEHVAASVAAARGEDNVGDGVITVSCHDDLSSWDLLGRYVIESEQTRWLDGPLTTAVREGTACYLDEIAEARRDTTVLLHSLTDYRRTLFIDRTNETLEAPDGFVLLASYNPSLAGSRKRLKESTRQRFVPIELDYLPPQLEAMVVAREAGIDSRAAAEIVEFGQRQRRAAAERAAEPVSTRGLVYIGKLIVEGVAPRTAAGTIVIPPAEDDQVLRSAMHEIVGTSLE
ncbi:MAG: AAA family ATPase [Acidimicrobiia bacterium]